MDIFDDGADPGDVGNHLWLAEEERLWDLGPATADTDADGLYDSLSRNDADGMTVFTDSDHDGCVDLITRVGADGSVTSSVYDAATRRWSSLRPGRIH
ncbi:hypothetical protein HUN08_18000 [Gordonia sp. X0973]|uniref:DUF6802 family protein n=1 Tax=Gordonia sp. X0973 TaxID=2742602 RepID=UPI000F52B88C|nr:DUF6802 family protein [Gordonia sp. X0973]QKT08890.1 hypothetical protein HUN08_18000 [Gordonia sp. X0973]